MAQRWIVGIDGSDTAVDALRWAARHAVGRDAELTALGAFVVPAYLALFVAKRGMGVDEVGLAATTAHEIDVALAAVADDVEPGEVTVQPVVVEGPASQVLVDAAVGADLLVVGRRGTSELRNHFFGSVSRYCTTHAEVPVIVVPSGWSAAPAKRIVVGFDASAHAVAAVRWALDFAGDVGSVKVVSAIDVAPWLDPATTRERFGDEVHVRELALTQAMRAVDPDGRAEHSIVLHGPQQALNDLVDETDLLVVGARGSGTALFGMLGSVSTWAIHRTTVPVAVIPHQD